MYQPITRGQRTGPRSSKSDQCLRGGHKVPTLLAWASVRESTEPCCSSDSLGRPTLHTKMLTPSARTSATVDSWSDEEGCGALTSCRGDPGRGLCSLLRDPDRS